MPGTTDECHPPSIDVPGPFLLDRLSPYGGNLTPDACRSCHVEPARLDQFVMCWRHAARQPRPTDEAEENFGMPNTGSNELARRDRDWTAVVPVGYGALLFLDVLMRVRDQVE